MLRTTLDIDQPVSSFKSVFRDLIRGYEFDVVGLYMKDSSIRPLPRESSVVGKVLEISINEYLSRRLLLLEQLQAIPASNDRTYPDITFAGAAIHPHRFALDVKCARRNGKGNKTDAQITIGTFDAEYFRYPNEKSANIMMPYSNYLAHFALIALYTYEDATARDVELLIVEKWRVATRKRSSGTRCYIGALRDIEALRNEAGEFKTEEEFNAFWRQQPINPAKEARWLAKRAKKS